MANGEYDAGWGRPMIKEKRGHGVSLSTNTIQALNTQSSLTHPINMSAVNNPSSESLGARLVNGHQWKPAHGQGLISRTSIRRPKNDRFDEGPYLSCEQVGTRIQSLL
jgi:hypothetical protein